MSTWGATDIKIIWGSLRPNVTQSTIMEIPLSPDPDNISAICSVLQQQGRKRLRQTMRLYFDSLTDYDSMVTDHHAGTIKTLADTLSGLSVSCVIESMAEPEFVQDNCVFVDVTFVEATP